MTTASRVIPVIALVSLLSISWLHTFDISNQQQSTDNQKKGARPTLSLKNIMFVDVRKSGGSLIKNNFEVLCEDSNCTKHVPDSTLSHCVRGYLHVKESKPPGAVEKADAYLFNLRHAIDRIRAWYHYEHPSACLSQDTTRKACSTQREIDKHPNGDAALFYDQCFPTIDLLSRAFHPTDNVLPKECINLAYRLLNGQLKGPGFRHCPFSFDLRYYMAKTIDLYPDKSVVVLRSEHLGDDLQDLEYQLGGEGTFHVFEEEGNNDSPNANYGPMCCAMVDEMHAYRRLLQLAINLDEARKKETLRYAVDYCGFTSWNDMIDQCHQLQKLMQPEEELSFRNILFVDVRKSLGSYFRKNVFQSYCDENPKQCSEAPPPSKLSKYTTGYMHGKNDPPNKVVKAADAFLFNLRHPADRLLALYHYKDPDWKPPPRGAKLGFAIKCFHRRSDARFDHECTEIALRVLREEHTGRGFKPLVYYVNVTLNQYPKKSVLVMRSDSLVGDMNDLDVKLGGSGTIDAVPKDLPSIDESNDAAVYASLCCALQDDIHEYRRLLKLAKNMDEETKEATIANAIRHCGFSSWDEMLDQCKEHLAQTQRIRRKNPLVPQLQSKPALPFENIVFVHVGKAGGQTLRALFKAFCESDRTNIPEECVTAPDSTLSEKTKGYIHPKEVRPARIIETADAFLFDLRHPVDRMISWYHYEHPKSCLNTPETRLACRAAQEVAKNPTGTTAHFFQECFPTQSLLPMVFNHSVTNSLSHDCRDLGRLVLEGAVSGRGFKHISYNIKYYTNLTIGQYPDTKVLAVRTERLWDDFKNLDIQLGGKGTFGDIEGTKDSHGSEKYRKSNETLSVEDYGLLCCGLIDEMEIYRQLMESAVNLDDASATITSAANRCGFSSWSEMTNHCSISSS